LDLQTSKPILHLLDTFVTVVVVWSLGPLFWITLGYVFDQTIFPDDYEWATITSAVAGYLAVILFWVLQEPVKKLSATYEQNQT
jgi:hypothetical protein